MIRYNYILNKILTIYKIMPTISFPLDVVSIISLIPNYRYMSYQKLAKISGCTVYDIIKACCSEAGCTHYDQYKNRYLVLCNHSKVYNSLGRQQWTRGHELGHIVCGHLNKPSNINYDDKLAEQEADFFAANLLAPFPVFSHLGITSADDIQTIFGLSSEASKYRYDDYVKWKTNHIKTAWNNDIFNEYISKSPQLPLVI